MTYVEESIGEEYKQWKGGDVVFLTSPTGSGKTTFALKVLLPKLALQGDRMLYLVNRTVLKRQLEEEVRDLPLDQQRCIEIKLYQTIEKRMSAYFQNYSRSGCGNLEAIQDAQNYHCVICDEAHYFCADSNYNTNTVLSYKYVEMAFCNKLRIYMSATINQVQDIIKKDFDEQRFIKSFWLNYSPRTFSNLNVDTILRSGKIWKYEVEKDYSYLDIHILRRREEVSDVIKSEEGKWLIFVDSKEFGRILKKEIVNKLGCEEKDVAFITSDYEEDEDTMDEVQFLARKKKQLSRVLIATSVLDNGISLHDMELRNLIIIADTEIEFIQMLGRKRKDGNSTKLYIFRLDKNYFLKRQRKTKQRLDIANQYCHEMYDHLDKFECYGQGEQGLRMSEFCSLVFQHKKWLRKLMNRDVEFENIRALFLDVDGLLVLNRLSFENVTFLNQFYSEIIKQLEDLGEDAYLYKQLCWLKKDESEIKEILKNENDRAYSKARENVIFKLEEVSERELTKKEAINLKVELADDLMILSERMGIETYINLAKKNDRPISDKFMTALRENCQIPFCLLSTNGQYLFKKEEI